MNKICTVLSKISIRWQQCIQSIFQLLIIWLVCTEIKILRITFQVVTDEMMRSENYNLQNLNN